jgi:hypothetical protein
MAKHYYYNVDTLEAELRDFEQRFGLTSQAFYEAYQAGIALGDASGHDRFIWADIFREVRRMRHT